MNPPLGRPKEYGRPKADSPMSVGSRPRLLVTRSVFPEVIEHLETVFDVESNPQDDLWSAEELRARAADKDALFVVTSDKVDSSLLQACPACGWLRPGSVGYNHIDLAACARKGLVVTNTPDVLTEATADMAFALLMATARRVTESERWLRQGHWQRWAWTSSWAPTCMVRRSGSSAWDASARRSRAAPWAST